MIMERKVIKNLLHILSPFCVLQGAISLSYLYSAKAFANIEVAFLSAFFVILGSSFAYKKMVSQELQSENIEEKRELLDTIEDPHELYEEYEINEAKAEDLDLKEIVRQEKAKIKTFSLKNMKHGARGSISLFRIVPYIVLILGFIALKNNEALALEFYLPALLLGIILGGITSKRLS